MPARTSPSPPDASGTSPALNNVVRFPARGHARKSRAPARADARSADGTNASTTTPAKVIILPAARPAPPLPGPHKDRVRTEKEAYCSAGEACVAYPSLGSPAKLSCHNRQEIAGNRYCYGCLSRIADGRTRTIATRRDSETSAASRHGGRRSTPAASRLKQTRPSGAR